MYWGRFLGGVRQESWVIDRHEGLLFASLEGLPAKMKFLIHQIIKELSEKSFVLRSIYQTLCQDGNTFKNQGQSPLYHDET